MLRPALLMVTLALGACSAALPAPHPSPASASPLSPLRVATDGSPFTPPGCVAVREQTFAGGASTSHWRCQAGTTDAVGFTKMLRTSANAQGWRECTPGMLFVREDTVMTVSLDPDPPLSPPVALPTDRGQREFGVTIAVSKRSAPTC